MSVQALRSQAVQPDDLGVRLMAVTPETAREWLAKNVSNRPLNRDIAETYARDMRAGRWQLNGETIKFNVSGNLTDGQHRLEAVRISGETIQTFVAFGLPDEMFETIDAGKRRTMADVLAVQHEANATTIAAALTVIWRYQRGYLFVAQTQGGIVPTHKELLDLFATHRNIRHSVGPVKPTAKLLGSGLATGLHYLFATHDSLLADWFFEHLGSGENLTKGDPVLALRRRLLDNRAATTKLPRSMIARLVVRAWNHKRHDEPITLLRPGADTKLEIV